VLGLVLRLARLFFLILCLPSVCVYVRCGVSKTTKSVGCGTVCVQDGSPPFAGTCHRFCRHFAIFFVVVGPFLFAVSLFFYFVRIFFVTYTCVALPVFVCDTVFPPFFLSPSSSSSSSYHHHRRRFGFLPCCVCVCMCVLWISRVHTCLCFLNLVFSGKRVVGTHTHMCVCVSVCVRCVRCVHVFGARGQ